MPLTNFPNGVSSFGVPIAGGGMPATSGNYYFVDATNGSDNNRGDSWTSALKTVAAAYALTTTNNNDVIVLSANAVHTISAMLDVSKSRVHFVGDVFGRKYGQRARLNMGVTTAVTDVFVVKNTGIGNTFTGIKFMSDNTLTQHVATVGEGGEYACGVGVVVGTEAPPPSTTISSGATFATTAWAGTGTPAKTHFSIFGVMGAVISRSAPTR